MPRRVARFKVQPEEEKSMIEGLKVLTGKDKGVLIVPGYTFDGRYNNVVDRQAITWTHSSSNMSTQADTQPYTYMYTITKTGGNSDGWSQASVSQALTGDFNVNYKITRNSSSDSFFVGLSTSAAITDSIYIVGAPYFIQTGTTVSTFDKSSPDPLTPVDTGRAVNDDDIFSIERKNGEISFMQNGNRFNILESSATYYLRVSIYMRDTAINSLTLSL